MTAPGRWFAEADPRESSLSDAGRASQRPYVDEQTASRLLIPAPTAGQARTVLPDRAFEQGDRPATVPALVRDRARTLRDVAIIEDEPLRGSVSLASLSAMAAPAPAPWDRNAKTGGGQGFGRPWIGKPDGVPLARRLAGLLQVPLELALAPDGPLSWPRPLFHYQLQGVRELIARESLLLADDMGLGKTVQSIASLRILLIRREIESALVVVPVGLLTQWRGELGRWAPELRVSTVHGAPNDRAWQWQTPAHVYLTSYETLRVDFSDNPHAPVARTWDLVVLDEAQKIKNALTDVSRVCKKLHRRRQWALTGTPLENSPDDLLSLLDFVDPRSGQELRRFVSTIGLRSVLGRVQLRRRKADVLHDLPPKLVSAVTLPLTPAQRESYDRAARDGIVELRTLGSQIDVRNVLDLIGRLRQICNFCPRTGESSKLIDLRERLAVLAAEGHKALVFTQFANREYGARAIAARLGPTALAYTGDQSQAARDLTLQRFKADPERRVLVLSLGAGGYGLNVQEASYVFHFDRWWNPAVVGQAEARSHRLGQRRAVNVYSYTSDNTIEERLDQILKEKQLLFDDLVDGVSIDASAALSSDDLFGLFDLAPPTAVRRSAATPG